jgi:hypothetical protein
VSTTGDDAMLTDWRYVTQVAEQAPSLEVVELKKDKHLWTPLARALADRGARRLGFESGRVPHAWHADGAEAVDGVAWVPTKGWVERQRAIKDAYEIAKLRAAQAITDAVFAEVKLMVAPGVSERELAVEMRHRIELAGGDNYPNLPIVASGWRAALPHGRASSKRIERGEFVLFDFGAIKDGYHGRHDPHGGLRRGERRPPEIYRLVLEAEQAGVALAAAGVTGQAIDRACRAPILRGDLRSYARRGAVSTGTPAPRRRRPRASPPALRVPRDDLVLQVAAEVDEVVAVARDPHEQVAVVLGVRLRVAQHRVVDHVELDVVAVQPEVAADQVQQLLEAGVASQHLRQEALVEERAARCAAGPSCRASGTPPWGRGGRRRATARCRPRWAGRRGGRRPRRRACCRSRRGRWSTAC